MIECSATGCFKTAFCKGLCKMHYNRQWKHGDIRYNGRINRRKPITYDIDSDGCFKCTSHAKRKDGYISYQYNRRMIPLHRYIYEQCFGVLDNSLVVMHTCDVRDCINPEHLKEGTPLDNFNDMVSKKRAFWQKEVQV
jgi:hypothetical protein